MTERGFAELYRAFEDKFRGDRDLITSRLKIYEPLIATIAPDERHRAIDLGSGRGEWLALTLEWGFRQAIGVEPDVSMHEFSGPGVEIVASDALTFLREQGDGSAQLITGFHVVEHVDPDYAVKMIREMHRVLSDGGVMILETPNPENLMVGLWSFHLDPTHKRPIPPVLLEFQVGHAGFEDRAIIRLNGANTDRNRASVIGLLANLAPDYAIVARKAKAEGGAEEGAENAVCSRFSETVSQQSPANFERMIDLEVEQGQITRTAAWQAQDALAVANGLVARLEALEARPAFSPELIALQIADFGRRLDAVEGRHLAGYSAADIAALVNRLDGLEEFARHTVMERDVMLASRSWRVTAPLRSLSTALTQLPRLRAAVAQSRLVQGCKRNGRRAVRGMARRSAHVAHGILQHIPGGPRIARSLLDRSPLVKRRLRILLLPPHLADAIAPNSAQQDPGHSVLTRTVRLATERLDWSAQFARARSAPGDGADRPDRPRLAYVSPMPPDRSGIADYSAQLLPGLLELYDVTAICVTPEAVGGYLTDRLDVRGISWFEQNAWQFDRIVYHFGNSLFHHHMIPLLQRIPGVVVLHDFYLSGMLAYLELYGGHGTVWTQALMDSHGYEAVLQRWQDPTHEAVVNAYPANFDIIAMATGIITHSQFSLHLAEKFYPALDTSGWQVVPLCRATPEQTDREAARRAIGIGPDDVLVCSFGFLGYTKLNSRLLDAWLASPLSRDPRCHLLFVGAAPADAYTTELFDRIKRHGQGRVRVTGFVDTADYARHLAAADIAVQLRSVSRGETSAAVLDCLSYGLPTIVNANGSMGEIPADKIVQLPDHFSDEELIAALIALFTDTTKRLELGVAAASFIQSDHSVEAAARRYHDAIESFYAEAPALYDHQQVIGLAQGSVTAAQLADRPGGALVRPARQLLVDVSALVREDLRSGIQRVVRAVVLELFRLELIGYRVEPVWLNNDDGAWRYYYARQFTLGLLSSPVVRAMEEPVEANDGDIFLGLDYFAHGVIGAWRETVYAGWRERDVRIAFVVYDVLPITMPQFFPDDSRDVHELWLDAISDVADDLICISKAVAFDVRSLLDAKSNPRGDAIRISAFPLGADIGASAPTQGITPQDRETLNRISATTAFLMVGTIEPRKGHRQVLQAFEKRWARGSEELLVLVGSPGWKGVPASQSRGLPETIRMLQDHPERGRKLIWFEAASDELLDAVYDASDVLVAASEGEGFGLPLVEAAQRGLPILARDITVFREVAKEHAAYFDAPDDTALADAIDAWLADFQAGTHPLSDDLRWYSWHESADRLWRVLDTRNEQRGKAAEKG